MSDSYVRQDGTVWPPPTPTKGVVVHEPVVRRADGREYHECSCGWASRLRTRRAVEVHAINATMQAMRAAK
jgi:hypothetical protein